MATLISAANGLFSAATTWKKVASGGLLDTTPTGGNAQSTLNAYGWTQLATTDKDSTAFTLAAVTIDGFALRLAERYYGAGAPTGTMTAILRNVTTGVNVYTVTINIADLAATYTGDVDAGWYFFNPGATHTPNGTDTYLIRLKVSATTYGVWMATNATTNNSSTNWAHMVREDTTQAPAAGDVLMIMGELTGAGAWTTRTVTMDLTTPTDFGIDNTAEERPALSINDHGVLAYGFAASTNYVLRLSGHLKMFSGSLLTIGTVANPIPRTSTAVLEFDCGAPAPTNEWGLIAHHHATIVMQGQSRTAGNNTIWALLTANVAAGALTAVIDRDTGWLAGDDIGIASTSTTPSQSEERTLSANATFIGDGHDLVFGALTNAHLGSVTDFMQAEVVHLTRNVKVRSTSSTAYAHVYVQALVSVDIDWVEFRYLGSVNNSGVSFTASTMTRYSVTGTGTQTIAYCSWRDIGSRAMYVYCPSGGGNLPTGTVVMEHCVAYRVGIVPSTDGASLLIDDGGAGAGHSYDDLVGVYQVATAGSSINSMFRLARLEGSRYTNFRSAGATGSSGIRVEGVAAFPTNCTGKQLGPWSSHGGLNSSSGFRILHLYNAVFEPLTAWHNTGIGIFLEGFNYNNRFKRLRMYGNQLGGIDLYTGGSYSSIRNMVIEEWSSAGTTTVIQPTAMYHDTNDDTRSFEFRVEKGDFGIATTGTGGLHVKHSTAHFSWGSTNKLLFQTTFNNCLFDATTTLFAGGFYGLSRSYHRFQRYNREVNNHFTQTPEGKIAIATETTDPGVLLDPPGVKMTPSSAVLKLDTAAGIRGRGFLVAANDGQAATVRVSVRKTAAYNGAAPRLIFKANSGLAFDTDQVGDTMVVAADTWEFLSYTTPPVIGNGVLEFVVDCDGTAGSVFVDTWNVE